ncbi:type II toxin-antitoxin system RelE family toxin [Reinekea thalattae]|uniref:Type II toxin-antitoxin system RelE/ParE family toxin n=1 Tax=Reinekea thalattae TaxID=2593301 RepID=A0A5C8Z598_9GAMM|nr:type II toxin-antitoxin system RelE/ParE family toxin [Reinekea thalattae]TXR52090.1 type II toxin-antitoxin system RelE/ParE family toxin [Reinekea thalattae]
MNKISWTKKAFKQLRKIATNDQKIIVAKVGALAAFPDVQNIKRLTNHSHTYRLRVGNYRVFFEHEEQLSVIKIEEVKKRDERTY